MDSLLISVRSSFFYGAVTFGKQKDPGPKIGGCRVFDNVEKTKHHPLQFSNRGELGSMIPIFCFPENQYIFRLEKPVPSTLKVFSTMKMAWGSVQNTISSSLFRRTLFVMVMRMSFSWPV